MKIKFCGLRKAADIAAANKVVPEFIGFVFAEKSKRKITLEEAQTLKKMLDKNIMAVGVFVNQPLEFLLDLYRRKIIDIIQLHGDEGGDYIDKIKQNQPQAIVTKAFRIGNMQHCHEIENSCEFENCDYFLFDAYDENAYGGTGKTVEISLLPKVEKPYFLAGGLTAENVKTVLESIEQSGKKLPFAVDVSSGVEIDGAKDLQLMLHFARNVRY